MSTELSCSHPLLGPVGYRLGRAESGAAVELLGETVARQLERLQIPQLAGLPLAGGGRCDGWLTFHRQAIPQLRAFFGELEAQGLVDRLRSFGGAFDPRLRRVPAGQPAAELSAHALGLAFDLNPEHNPLGDPSTRLFGHPGGLRELMTLAERHGFRWGGFDEPPNASHFEVRRFLAPGETVSTRAVVRLDGKPHGGLPAFLIGDDYYADATRLATLLGGKAEPLVAGNGPGPFPVRVSHGAVAATLDGLRRGTAVVVPLGELLPLFDRQAWPLAGLEQVGIGPR